MLVSRFLDTVRRLADKPVLKDSRGELTFSQLANLAQTIRGIVLAETSCPRVGLMLPTSSMSTGTIVGILWAGKTFVPLNFLLAPAELARIVADAGIDLILSTSHFNETLSQVPVRTLCLEKMGLKWRYLLGKLRSLPSPPDVGPDDLAAIVYTSATTGRSKGVCLTHNNFVSNTQAIMDHLRMRPDDRFLAVLPNFHVFGLTVLNLLPALHGPMVSCLPRFVPADVYRTIVEDRLDVLIAVPSMFAALAHVKNIQPADFAHVRISASGGEPLPRRIYDDVCERTGMQIIEGYGMTETSPIISADLPWAHKVGTVGPPLPGVQIQLRDTENQVVPIPTSRGLAPDRAGRDQPARSFDPADPEGELYVRGLLVMQGYYQLPEDTAAVIDRDGWLRTGDIVRIDADGYLRITGRAKDLIIVAGENVYPREIEDVLDRHPAIAQSAVIGRKDDLRGEAVVGFVVLHEGQSVSSTELRAFCRQHLAGFKVPREIHIRPELPRGPTGKVIKRALPAFLDQV